MQDGAGTHTMVPALPSGAWKQLPQKVYPSFLLITTEIGHISASLFIHSFFLLTGCSCMFAYLSITILLLLTCMSTFL